MRAVSIILESKPRVLLSVAHLSSRGTIFFKTQCGCRLPPVKAILCLQIFFCIQKINFSIFELLEGGLFGELITHTELENMFTFRLHAYPWSCGCSPLLGQCTCFSCWLEPVVKKPGLLPRMGWRRLHLHSWNTKCSRSTKKSSNVEWSFRQLKDAIFSCERDKWI